MSDDLAIGRPGATSVTTTALAQHAQRLTALEGALAECARRLARVAELADVRALRLVDAPISSLRALEAVEEARRRLSDARERITDLAEGLTWIATRYEEGEAAAARLATALSGLFAHELGRMLPLITLLMAPTLAGLGGGAALWLARLGPEDRERVSGELAAWLASNTGALTDPAVVEAVRNTVMSADDLAAGRIGAPNWVAMLLGDSGVGLVGVSLSASAVVGWGARAGLIGEADVRVQGSAGPSAAPVAGLADRIARIPDRPHQIRIDRYEVAGEPDRYEVYLAGTRAGDVAGGSEPWDMGSNLLGMAGEDGGSYRAVRAALAEAGAGADSPVVVTGYSQGGLVAARLAASGEWNVQGLVTVGAPAGPVEVPRDIPYLALEHSDDLVPALGGRFVASEPLLVRRRVFEGAVDTSASPLPAHELDRYLETARRVDGSEDTRVRELILRLDSRGRLAESMLYVAERKP